jgi:DNA invertase Pin-like site-specific DNA recombinase
MKQPPNHNPPEDAPPPVLIIYGISYGAKSTVDEKGSLGTQKAGNYALAKRDGVEIVAHYETEDASAYHGNRDDQLDLALSHCEHLSAEHGRSWLGIEHSSRLARGDGVQAKHLVEYVIWAASHNVTIRSVQDPSAFPDDRDMQVLLGAISGMQNHQFSARLSKAVKNGMRRRAEDCGKLCGGLAPFATRWVGPDGKKDLEWIPDLVPVVEDVHKRFVTGTSMKLIARSLIDAGVPTASGGEWRPRTIRNVLTQPL